MVLVLGDIPPVSKYGITDLRKIKFEFKSLYQSPVTSIVVILQKESKLLHVFPSIHIMTK